MMNNAIISSDDLVLLIKQAEKSGIVRSKKALLETKENVEKITDDLAIFNFQDQLAKFCPGDKTRPSSYERIMFQLGVEAAFEFLDEALIKLDQDLKNEEKNHSQGSL